MMKMMFVLRAAAVEDRRVARRKVGVDIILGCTRGQDKGGMANSTNLLEF